MFLDGNVKANVNLEEMTKVMPIQDLTLRGALAVDASAKGTYSKTQMPVMQAALNLTNGYVKSKDFPAPIEKLSCERHREQRHRPDERHESEHRALQHAAG